LTPSKPGVSAKGSFNIATKLKPLATVSNVERALATVPLEIESFPRDKWGRNRCNVFGTKLRRLHSLLQGYGNRPAGEASGILVSEL
jgi:hypothetical protein